jgi:hypothetical protein
MANNIIEPTLNQSNMDGVVLKRQGITLFLILSTVIVGFFAVRMNNPIFTIGLLVLPFALMLMYRPQIALVLAVIMDASGLSIPGLSFTTAGLLAKVLLIGVAILGLAMGHRQWKAEKLPEKRPLIIFFAVIIVLMIFRGAGLKFFGSSTWGGMNYVNSMAGILFFLFVSGMRINIRHVRWMIYGSLIFAAVGSIISRQGWTEEALYSEIMESRIRWVYHFAMALLPFSLACISRRRTLLSIALVVSAVYLLMITGDRKLFILSVFVLSGVGYFKAAGKFQYIVKLLIIGLIGFGALFFVAKKLPLGMQRAVSVLPGISVDHRMGHDARGSADWRIEIWKYCLAEAPKYLLVGRGSAFNVYEAGENVNTADIETYSPWFAFTTRSYHSGPLSLLIDYGIPGLLAMVWFSCLLLKRLYGYASRLASMNSFEAQYALATCVILMGLIFRYFFIMGAILEWAQFIGQLAVIIIVVNSIFPEAESAQVTADSEAGEEDESFGEGRLALGTGKFS